MLENLPSGDPIGLGNMFPHASPEAVDLMSKLLHFNPNKRITPQEALEHPYVVQFHDHSQEPVAPHIITVPINDNTKVRCPIESDQFMERTSLILVSGSGAFVR